MTKYIYIYFYTLLNISILFQTFSFKQYFYVSLDNNFSIVFLWRPLSCGGPWATAQFAPPPKSGPAHRQIKNAVTVESAIGRKILGTKWQR